MGQFQNVGITPVPGGPAAVIFGPLGPVVGGFIGAFVAVVAYELGEISSKTARRLIKQWASVHRDKLEANWKKMKQGRTLEKIAPLE